MFSISPKYLTWGIVAVLVAVFYFLQKKYQSGGLGFTGTPVLDKYTKDLTHLAAEGKLDPVIGRHDEIQRLIQILSRRTKNNALLVGKAGTGKTAIAEGLALKIAQAKQIPLELSSKRVLELDVAEVLAGTKYRGEFEERAKKILNEIDKANRGIILFIDEIHTLIQTQGTEGAINFSDIIKPSLARGKLQLIGATTMEEYEKYIKPQSSLERRFQIVEVKEPTQEETILILNGLKEKYMAYHKVEFTPAAINAAAELSEKYVKNRQLPDKAIDAIDEAAAMVKVAHLDKHIAGILHGAAKDKNPAFADNWKKIKEIDQRILKTQLNSSAYKNLYIEREKLEGELYKNLGEIVVDMSDIQAVIAGWTGKKPEEIIL
ncbi:MAG: AAA family ATPase [Parcubacteria group bacterium]